MKRKIHSRTSKYGNETGVSLIEIPNLRVKISCLFGYSSRRDFHSPLETIFRFCTIKQIFRKMLTIVCKDFQFACVASLNGRYFSQKTVHNVFFNVANNEKICVPEKVALIMLKYDCFKRVKKWKRILGKLIWLNYQTLFLQICKHKKLLTNKETTKDCFCYAFIYKKNNGKILSTLINHPTFSDLLRSEVEKSFYSSQKIIEVIRDHVHLRRFSLFKSILLKLKKYFSSNNWYFVISGCILTEKKEKDLLKKVSFCIDTFDYVNLGGYFLRSIEKKFFTVAYLLGKKRYDKIGEKRRNDGLISMGEMYMGKIGKFMPNKKKRELMKCLKLLVVEKQFDVRVNDQEFFRLVCKYGNVDLLRVVEKNKFFKESLSLKFFQKFFSQAKRNGNKEFAKCFHKMELKFKKKHCK